MPRFNQNVINKKYFPESHKWVFIDEKGIVVKVIAKPKVKEHAAEIAAGFGL
jgi:hypothetical protein